MEFAWALLAICFNIVPELSWELLMVVDGTQTANR